MLERVSRDKRVVHLRDHLAIDDVEELADCLRKCVISMRSPRTSKRSGLWWETNIVGVVERARKKPTHAHPMRPALADQVQRDVLHVRAVVAAHELQALREIPTARAGRVERAERENESAKHVQILLLQDRHVLWRLMHEDVDDTAGANADAGAGVSIRTREGRYKNERDERGAQQP